MANGFSPYQVAGPTVNLMGQTGVAKKKKKETDIQTSLQMGKMEESFQQEMDKLGLEAKGAERGSKGTRRAELGAQILSMFGGPLLAGLLGGFLGGKKHRRARKARKKLLNLQDKWGKTFLRGGARDYLSEAESLQLDKSGDFTSALKTGVTSGLMSRLMGGKIKGAGKGSFMSKFGTGEGTISKLGSPEGFFRNIKMKDILGRGGLEANKGYFSQSPLFEGGFDAKTAMLLPTLLQSLLGEQEY